MKRGSRWASPRAHLMSRIAQLSCARRAMAAGPDMSRGTPIRSRKYSRQRTSRCKKRNAK